MNESKKLEDFVNQKKKNYEKIQIRNLDEQPAGRIIIFWSYQNE